jgi:putative glutamine amidotransferase
MNRFWRFLREIGIGLYVVPLALAALPMILFARFSQSRGRLRIGVSVSDQWQDRFQFRRLPYDLAIARANADVLTFVPNDPSDIDKMLDKVDGLVLAGGEDVGHKHYAGDPQSIRRVNPGRDELELALLNKALERKLPVLCICRGAQLLAVWAGGRLKGHHHDEELMRHHVSTFRRMARHSVSVVPGTRLHAILGCESLPVNSFHRYSITDPGRLVVTAMGGRDMIEAVELPGERFVIGVQWHPELEAFYRRNHQALFNALVSAAHSRRKDFA